MTQKSKNTAKIWTGISSWLFVLLFLLLWELSVSVFKIEKWILPAPSVIFISFFNSLGLILHHSERTLIEALLGLFIGSFAGIVFAMLMEWSAVIKKIVYPFMLVTQTIPFITLAPLLVIWFGYGITAKIIIIALVCFFPIAVNLELGFSSTDRNYIRLVRSMGADNWHVFKLVSIPFSLPFFFSGLRIAASYAVLSAVLSEWIGSDRGLGILLIRSSKSYLTARVFAVVAVISVISLILVKIVDYLSVKSHPWHYE